MFTSSRKRFLVFDCKFNHIFCYDFTAGIWICFMSKKVFKFKTFRVLSEAARILLFVGQRDGIKNWVEVKITGTAKAKRKTSQVLSKLKAGKFLEIRKIGGQPAARLTEKGIIEFYKLELVLVDELPKGFRCLVVFDIPQKRSGLRDLFRIFLKENCFFPFQKSVWISSFDMVEILRKIFVAWKIEDLVKVFVVCDNYVSK